jgi:NADP-dependent aldehyde dehydrogenase
MTFTGQHLIDGAWSGAETGRAAADLEGLSVAQATEAEIDAAVRAARRDFRAVAGTPAATRVALLHAIAEEIDALGDAITATGMAETGLPEARLVGERGRTTGQLRMFADLIRDRAYLGNRHDPALPDRQPLPRPDLKLTKHPLGPVVVFGASNFPLAFSTAGGDTASALAAGCPVIVKGHPAHPGTTELVAQAIAAAVARVGMPPATFQMVHGAAPAVGAGLVTHPEVAAVGFTGSLGAGRALFDLCAARPVPIPFYGELGSINPVFCLPAALAARAEAIGQGWVASLTMGAGQFCTNPGVILGIAGPDLDRMAAAAAEALAGAEAQTMLTPRICEAYGAGVAALRDRLEVLAETGPVAEGRAGRPIAFRTDGATFLATPELRHEVFGAAGIVVACADAAQMLAVAEALEGQLTATLQLDMPDDVDLAQSLMPALTERAGRILCNGFPTGVEVAPAMMHGGPYPASTDSRATSVGTMAIDRWLRPVCYQSVPEALLPAGLV